MTGRAAKVPVAVVVSAHGFGHAARASAVMEALAGLRPELAFHVMTTVPRWFFEDSLTVPFTLHRLRTDVGLVQRTPLVEDLAATVSRLDHLLSPSGPVLERLTGRIQRIGCRMVICDVAPLGLAAARRLSIASVLVESFTWDWIYRGYRDAPPELGDHAVALATMFDDADVHIQAEPWCLRRGSAVPVPPVARAPKTDRDTIRKRLGVPLDRPMVLLTMGGVGWSYRGLEELASHPAASFVVPGGAAAPEQRGRLALLPFRSEFHHRDLVQAADLVVGKLGYSTVAETWRAGAAMAFIGRARFPESPVLAAFVRRTMSSVEITEPAFNDGSWLAAVEPLLHAPRRVRRRTDGAEQAARAILDRMGDQLE